jgi:AraC family transcriptional regulator, regulatory protein of adaptative response / DNA-3-methyladenine glycosylase II
MTIICLETAQPFDWQWMLGYLRQRAFAGVEWVDGHSYYRSVDAGWIKVDCVEGQIKVDLFTTQTATKKAKQIRDIEQSLIRLFDLDANPLEINRQLGVLAKNRPGTRLPGAFDGFELAVRAVLGQQITVKAATTLSGRFSQRFGVHNPSALAGAPTQISAQFPPPSLVAQLTVDDIAQLGIIARRAQVIILLAQALDTKQLDLSPTANERTALKVIEQLCALPGIGPWTANYIAMRALKWRDALPAADVALYKALGVTKAREVEAATKRYRPYRGYAVMHLYSKGDGSLAPSPSI